MSKKFFCPVMGYGEGVKDLDGKNPVSGTIILLRYVDLLLCVADLYFTFLTETVISFYISIKGYIID